MKRTKARRVLVRGVRSRPGCAARGARWWASGRSCRSGLDLLHGLHVADDRHHDLVGERAGTPASGGVDHLRRRRADWRSPVLTSRRWRSSVSWPSAWAPCWCAVAAAPPDPRNFSAREQRMSSVTIGRDLQTGSGAQPESESAARRRAAGSPPTPVARPSRARTSWSWRSPSRSSHPVCCSGRSRVFVLGVLAVCALRGQYASADHPEREQGHRHTGGGGRRAAHGDRGLRRVRPAGPPVRAGGRRHVVPALLGRACAYAGIRRARTKGAFAQRVLIVGAGQVAERFADVLDAEPELRAAPGRTARRLCRRVAVPPGAGWDRPARRASCASITSTGSCSRSA